MKKTMPKLLYSIIISILLAGCKNNKLYNIQQSLNMAKENRTEIQKALDHFPKGSDEYNAMCYLIEQMINHKSYDGHTNQKLRNIMRTTPHFDFKKIEWDFLSQSKEPKLNSDLNTITADYLINNVNEAYNTWSNCSWKKEISFDHFCEYILPYKIANEPIVEWRAYLKNKYSFLIEGVSQQKEAFFKVYNYISAKYNKSTFDYPYEQDALLLDLTNGGHCKERSYHMIYIMRALGISVALDYTPVWSNYGKNAHMWVALVNNENHIVLPSSTKKGFYIDSAYEPINYTIPQNYHYKVDSLKKVAKILRRSFSARKTNIDNDYKSRPNTFKDVKIHDVTSSYPVISKETLIDIDNTPTNSLYICTYNHLKGWYAVGYVTDIRGQKANIGPLINENVVLVAEYTNGVLIPRSYPHIILENGRSHKLIPDTTSRQKLKIYRKYMFSSRWINRWGEIIGTTVETSSSSNFKNSKCLFRWDQMPYEATTIKLDQKKLQKYLRILPAQNLYPTFAEIRLKNKNGERISLSDYRLFAIGENLTGDSLVVKSLQDNNEKTTFFKRFPFWIGIELKNHHDISELEVIMRNDENRIKPGNRYELFYFDHKWISLGEKIASNDYLEFDNAPTNAIFLIKNLTEGREERIFTYQNDMQVWW